MFRLIIWFLIIYFGYTLFKKFFKKTQEYRISNTNKEKMIQCENCKIYFPESSKIIRNGKNFCSKRCAESYEKD